MSSFQIKLLAIIFMLIDHIGLYFFPQIILLRAIGRLSFPLFAWLIASGAIHTSSINFYLKRLFIFGCISQIPFILVNRFFNPNFWELNIFFTLFLGLLAIKFLKEKRNNSVSILIVL